MTLLWAHLACFTSYLHVGLHSGTNRQPVCKNLSCCSCRAPRFGRYEAHSYIISHSPWHQYEVLPPLLTFILSSKHLYLYFSIPPHSLSLHPKRRISIYRIACYTLNMFVVTDKIISITVTNQIVPGVQNTCNLKYI